LTDNFPPEVNAPASRTYEHALCWVARGCKVTVITCFPNFPEGKIFHGYKNKWYDSEVIDGINVVRVKTFISANEGIFLRTIDYLSFMFSSFFAGLFQKKPDVILATSPQFFTSISGWLLATVRRRPFIFELRDLWPISIVAVGVMRKSYIIKLLEKLELFLYKKSDAIVSLTDSFKLDLTSRGIDPNKIYVIQNGVDLGFYQPIEYKDSKLLSKHSIKNKFIIGYIGTHGMAHGLEVVIDAAKKLIKYPEILFLMVGSGASKNLIQRLAKSENLNNILFIDIQPKKRIKSYYSICDLSLIHLKDNEVFSKVIPSKLFESMGMGIPILMSLPKGEATKIVEDHKCGVIIPPEDGKLLANSILELKSNVKDLKQLRESSIKASKKFSREVKANEMLKILRHFSKN
tara:strand:- start:4491 stop:5702 length:1212 start_codon:yes stop_codon:yes gene_type:complete